jgi:hypothetical protein
MNILDPKTKKRRDRALLRLTFKMGGIRHRRVALGRTWPPPIKSCGGNRYVPCRHPLSSA